MALRYNSDAAIKAFERHLTKTLQVIQHELLADAKATMLTPEGRNDLYADSIKAVAGIITTQITGGAWAVMDEWGTGSWMDRRNPHLDEYRRSPMWNPARKVPQIVSRPNQPGQIDIFGKHVNGRGKGGVDLERAGVVEPQAPSHAVQTAFRWMAQERFRWYLKRAMDTFPWGKYLIVTNTKG